MSDWRKNFSKSSQTRTQALEAYVADQAIKLDSLVKLLLCIEEELKKGTSHIMILDMMTKKAAAPLPEVSSAG